MKIGKYLVLAYNLAAAAAAVSLVAYTLLTKIGEWMKHEAFLPVCATTVVLAATLIAYLVLIAR